MLHLFTNYIINHTNSSIESFETFIPIYVLCAFSEVPKKMIFLQFNRIQWVNYDMHFNDLQRLQEARHSKTRESSNQSLIILL